MTESLDSSADNAQGSFAVEIRGLHKSYGDKRVLAGIDLVIERGQFLVLLGPSGSGKTTILRCVTGIERISSGRLAIEGQTVADGRTHIPPERRPLAMVFQDYALWPHMTVLANVAFALRRLHLPRDEGARRCSELLERVGLGGFAKRYPSELSGGEQQRVALARALVARPKLVVFDEPLSNLDADLRERLRVEIATLARENSATCIYITHDQSEAFALADQIGVLHRGNLAQLGRPEQVYSAPATPFVARFTGLAGELTGQVIEEGSDALRKLRPSGGALVEQSVRVTGGGQSALVTVRGHFRAAPGTRVRVFVRPNAVRLGSPTGEGVRFRATVLDCAFRGRGYEHALALSDGSQLRGVFAEERSERGENVGVHLDPRGCFLFTESDLDDRASE